MSEHRKDGDHGHDVNDDSGTILRCDNNNSSSSSSDSTRSSRNDKEKGHFKNKQHLKKRPAPARRNRTMDRTEELSRTLSWALRHQVMNLRLTIDEEGYVPVVELLHHKHPRFASKAYTLQEIQEVVSTNSKQRFHLQHRRRKTASCSTKEEAGEDHDGNENNNNNDYDPIETDLWIRANQGHSFVSKDQVLIDEKLLKPILNISQQYDMVVHGTTLRAWNSIKNDGLSRMKRHHIHFAKGLPNSMTSSGDVIKSGMRTNSQLHIYLNLEKCHTDQIPFFESLNGVILSPGLLQTGVIPPDYFLKVIHVPSGENLLAMDSKQADENKIP